MDAFAILYFRRDEVDFDKLKRMADGNAYPKQTLEHGLP